MKRVIILALALAVLVVSAITAFASPFLDVSDEDYYVAAAERMAAKGILSGFGDGRYYGEWPVTRAQIAALVCKMLGKTDEAQALMGETVFKDVLSTGWYTGYINYAVANGIIIGDGDGNFRPDDNVKYEEVVKVIVCVVGLGDNIKIDPADWSREYIFVATSNNLLFNLVGEKGTDMLRSDIAVICDNAMTFMEERAQTSETTTPIVTTGSGSSSGSGHGSGSGSGNSGGGISKPVTGNGTSTSTSTEASTSTSAEETRPPIVEEDNYDVADDGYSTSSSGAVFVEPDFTTEPAVTYTEAPPTVETGSGENELPVIWF